jgi:hypothetical protein
VTKERKATVVTLAVLSVGLLLLAWKNTGGGLTDFRVADLLPASSPAVEPTPQDAVYAMLDAARSGDVERYLAAFAPAMQANLRQAITEMTESGFARHLRETNGEIKGVAITEPDLLTPSEAKLRVEYVYQDRNEVQYTYLEKAGPTWKITRLDTAQRIKTLIPYGTPVE